MVGGREERVVVGGVKITRKRRNASHGKTGGQKRRRWPGIFALSSRARVLITGTRGVIFSPSPILASSLPPSFSGLVLAAFLSPPPFLLFRHVVRIVRMRQAVLIHHGTRRVDDRIVAKFATTGDDTYTSVSILRSFALCRRRAEIGSEKRKSVYV